MRKILLLPLACLLLASSHLLAQRTCGANEVLARQLMEDPEMKARIEAIEQQTNNFIQSGGVNNRTVVTIPVVVHVVYYNSTQNISDAAIQSQIDVLNADFRRLNADAINTPSAFQGVAADCEVNFCMATQTPSGAATTGIERRQTTVNGFSTNDAVKYYAQGGLDVWDRNKYLNLWVCNLSGGLLGYAQFPGGPAATDGVVCDYAYFGTIGSTAPFNLGRTATHEVGHWLNCYHIWGDDGTACTGTDQVTDTPNQADENYGCPAFPTISCSNGPNGDMFMNYMDYTDDGCMNLFTLGQKARMQAVLAPGGSRASLATSTGCQPPTGGSCGAPSGLNATNITQTSATLNWSAVSGATSYNLQWKTTSGSTWTTVSGLTSPTYALSGLTAGTSYSYQAQAVCSGTSSAYSTAATFTTQSAGGGCTDAYEPNETRNTAKTIPVNTTFTAQIASSTDKDWYKFANTSTTRNIKVDLTTLPADYDVRLYRSSTLLATSQNAGTANELIIYNTTTVSTAYYAYVYGYNGAFSNTQCYTLRVSLSASSWRGDGTTDGQVQEIEIPVVFEQEAAFRMFPNPASDLLTVEVDLESDGDVQVNVMDATGKIAVSQNEFLSKGNSQMNLDMNGLANGVYFVQVRKGDAANTRKLIIQH